MNGKLRVCRKCLPGQNNEETFYEDLSRYIPADLRKKA